MSTDESGWGRYLETAMAHGRLSSAELSRRSGVNETQISRWLRDHGQPTLDNLRRLAVVFNRPLLELAVAAGHLTAAEAKLQDVRPSQASDDLAAVAVADALRLLDDVRSVLIQATTTTPRQRPPAAYRAAARESKDRLRSEVQPHEGEHHSGTG